MAAPNRTAKKAPRRIAFGVNSATFAPSATNGLKAFAADALEAADRVSVAMPNLSSRRDCVVSGLSEFRRTVPHTPGCVNGPGGLYIMTRCARGSRRRGPAVRHGHDTANPKDGPARGLLSGAGLPCGRLRRRRDGIDAPFEHDRHAPLSPRDRRRIRRVASVRGRIRGAVEERPGPGVLPVPRGPRRPRHLLRPDGA